MMKSLWKLQVSVAVALSLVVGRFATSKLASGNEITEKVELDD